MIVLSVSKRFSNGNYRTRGHRAGCKKYWFIFAFDDFGRFFTKRISQIEVPYYKTQVKRVIVFQCQRCGFKMKGIKGTNPHCPKCEADN